MLTLSPVYTQACAGAGAGAGQSRGGFPGKGALSSLASGSRSTAAVGSPGVCGVCSRSVAAHGRRGALAHIIHVLSIKGASEWPAAAGAAGQAAFRSASEAPYPIRVPAAGGGWRAA